MGVKRGCAGRPCVDWLLRHHRQHLECVRGQGPRHPRVNAARQDRGLDQQGHFSLRGRRPADQHAQVERGKQQCRDGQLLPGSREVSGVCGMGVAEGGSTGGWDNTVKIWSGNRVGEAGEVENDGLSAAKKSKGKA